MNKEEKLKEYTKQWKLDNKEHLKEYRKQWCLDNKEKVKEYNKQLYLANKEYWKDRYENIVKTNDYRVYVLPNSNYYVGYTSVETERMNQHRFKGNDTTDYMILHIFDTKEEALWYESIYHKLGFPGKKGYKLKINKKKLV